MRRRVDIIFLLAACFLVLASLSTLYSIGVSSGESFFIRQLLFLSFGVLAFLAAFFVDYRILSENASLFYVLAAVFLAAVLFAEGVRGSARWISIGDFNFQPVEFAKVAVILILARFFSKKKGEVKSGRVLVHSLVLVLLPVVLVLLQPDLGSAVILFASWFMMLISSPVRKLHVSILILLIAGAAIAGWFGFLHDYQKERITTFINPSADLQGSGYNVRQSTIAVGSGQFWGRGLGKGFQSHLRFLPERHTDFIFASFAEELGFLGSSLIVIAFGILVWRLILTAKKSRDALGMYLCLGAASIIALQGFVNIGMNIGLVPVTGIPLPLMSYGGSSLIATFFMLGMSQSVYKRSAAGI